ncbi:MAG: aminomethyltransferase family protein [Haloferacaceae archaeon]
MTVVGEMHEDHGATFVERGGRRLVGHYGRPERAGRAVRNGVGAIEMGYGVVVVEGDDRVEFVDNTVSNRVPTADGQGRYALLLDPQGRIETDMYVYNAGERLLLFTPPDRAGPLVDDWQEKTFIQDVDLREASAEFGVFGVHGAMATEKVASVLTGASAPEGHLTFDRGSMGDAGVTVVASDAPLGEEGYEVICAAEQADEVFETLLTRGLNAAPFGYETFETLALEAGTPLFEPELEGRVPNVLGLTNAVAFDKGCFVGQELVSKVENRGQPSQRLVGLVPAERPAAGATVAVGGDAGETVGEITRAVESPTRGEPLALALLDYDCEATELTVRVDGEEVPAVRADLPFVEGSDRSARLPAYE